MKKVPKTDKPTFESVWAALQETDRLIKESRLEQKETERILKENAAETDRIVKETSKVVEETSKVVEETSKKVKETLLAIDKLGEHYGGLSNNIGQFAEDFFVNSFKNGQQNFFGETFDEIKPNIKGVVTDDEYDILLINGKSVCIIETKFKAHINHIPKVLNKARTFRLNFPLFKNFNLFLGMASLSFYDLLEEECKKNGIAIIKQIGENVVIIDEGLKIY